MKYAIYSPDKGYMCEDEDRMNGVGYDKEIDEFTIQFDNFADANLNCGHGEIVVMLENNELYGMAEVKRMTREDVQRIYGKVLP